MPLRLALGVRGTVAEKDLVAPVGIGGDPQGPRVAHEPVEHAVRREVGVRGAGVGDVADEGEDLLIVRLRPLRVELGDDGGGVDEVAVVEVVVVVHRVPEVVPGVLRHGNGRPRPRPEP